MGLNQGKFTREFTEGAVRRLELGTSVTEVARAWEQPEHFATLAARAARVRRQSVYRARPDPSRKLWRPLRDSKYVSLLRRRRSIHPMWKEQTGNRLGT